MSINTSPNEANKFELLFQCVRNKRYPSMQTDLVDVACLSEVHLPTPFANISKSLMWTYRTKNSESMVNSRIHSATTTMNSRDQNVSTAWEPIPPRIATVRYRTSFSVATITISVETSQAEPDTNMFTRVSESIQPYPPAWFAKAVHVTQKSPNSCHNVRHKVQERAIVNGTPWGSRQEGNHSQRWGFWEAVQIITLILEI